MKQNIIARVGQRPCDSIRFSNDGLLHLWNGPLEFVDGINNLLPHVWVARLLQPNQPNLVNGHSGEASDDMRTANAASHDQKRGNGVSDDPPGARRGLVLKFDFHRSGRLVDCLLDLQLRNRAIAENECKVQFDWAAGKLPRYASGHDEIAILF